MDKRIILREEMQRAKTLHGQGDFSGASSLYRELLMREPTFTDAQHFLGIALHQMGEPEKADEMLRDSLAQQPDNVAWWNNYGNVLSEQNDLKGADVAFAKVVALNPRSETAWANLGSVYQRQNLYIKAEEAYREALKINPRYIIGLKLLGNLLQQQNRILEGSRLHSEAILLDPDSHLSPLKLASAWLILERIDKAAEVYAEWIQKEPDNPIASFLYAACTGINVPEKCSQAYIETTFDSYASTFDHAQKQMSYRGPEMLGEILTEITFPDHLLDILDLGCGTGHCAKYLKPLARTLRGVDLSQKMLDLALEKDSYSGLVRADILNYLNEHPNSSDLIVSAECFIYFGELQKVFAALALGLRSRGIGVFTIESLEDSQAHSKLHATGRYCHSQEYIMSLIKEYGFEVIRVNCGVLRMEMCLPVKGSIWAIQKKL